MSNARPPFSFDSSAQRSPERTAKRSQPFLALLEEAVADGGSRGLPSPILGTRESDGRTAADVKRTPTRPDKPKSRRHATLATEPTRKRARPRPTPFDLEVSLPSAGTLPSETDEGFDTQEDLDAAVADALNDSDDAVRLPESIAGGTDLFRKRSLQERNIDTSDTPTREGDRGLQIARNAIDSLDLDDETGDFKRGTRPRLRAEKPLKRRFFEESTKRLSPFDPSSAEFKAANGVDEDPNDPLGLDAALDAPTASDDSALDRLVAKVREEKAYADGLPLPSSQSIDLDSLPIRDDENPLLSALDDENDDESDGVEHHAQQPPEPAAAAPAPLPSAKPKLPFASMLAESLSLQPLERVPPEFSLDDVDGLGPLKGRASEARDELAEVAPHAPQILEPVDDDESRPLPVSVGTPTCHWRLDANGQPHLAAIRFDAKSAPVPIEAFAEKVESGSINLADFGLDEDDFAPIREATGTYRAVGAPAPRPDDVDLPLHDLSQASNVEARCAPAPLDFADFDAPTFEGKVDATSNAPTADDRFVDVADFSDRSVEVAPEIDSGLDDVVESPVIPDDLDLEDIDASILADVSLTDMSLVLDSSAEAPPKSDDSFTPSRRVTPIDPSVDVERVCAPDLEPVVGALLDENSAAPGGFSSFEDDSLFDVSVSDFSPSKQSIAALSFAETSRGGLVGDQPLTRDALAEDEIDTSYADGVLPQPSGFDDDNEAETSGGNSLVTTQEAGEDSSISTVDLAMPEAAAPVRPPLTPRAVAGSSAGARASAPVDGITTIPLRESVAHLRALQNAPRAKPPLSRLTVEGQAVTEAARLESAVPSTSAAAVRPPMLPPKVARPRAGGTDGDRLRKGHDLYLLAMEKLEGGRTSEALLNAKLASAYDPDNAGYRELTAFITDQSRRGRPLNRAHL